MSLLSGVPDVEETFVSHLECSKSGEIVSANEIHNLSPKGFPLLVRYDLKRVNLTKEMLKERPHTLWRYRELLPVTKTENIVSLGEIMTPLISLSRLAKRLGCKSCDAIIVKDEGRLPTGSFKARGLAMAVSMAKELGVSKMMMPTNGNAGAALSAYASRAGMESLTFCPEDNTPQVNVDEMEVQGARVYKVNGYIHECGKLVKCVKNVDPTWFDVSTLKEPYRIEGKKTMGLELAEQFGWDTLPDAIFYPTGGGTGLIGMWKAFQELIAIGMIDTNTTKLPKMIAVQATGCAPIVQAYNQGLSQCDQPWKGNAHTYAAGIRVPVAIGDFLILKAIRESHGYAIAVSDDDIKLALTEVAQQEGLLLCPEGAATYAAYKKSLQNGKIQTTERVVLFNCATGLKYPMLPKDGGTFLDQHNHNIDYASL